MGVASQAFQDRMRQVEDYMASQHLDLEIRDQVRDVYKSKYADGEMYDEEEILNELTPTLRREISSFKSRLIINKVPFLRDQSPETLRKSSAAARKSATSLRQSLCSLRAARPCTFRRHFGVISSGGHAHP